LGGLFGNIALGFFLGMAAFFGQTFGLPFDIRHITISAANTAIGFFGIDHALSYREIIYTIFSVLMIGFLNFAISFGLSFFVAIKSRGIKLNESNGFGKMLWRYFKKYPLDFVRAPSKRNTDDLN
jgi:site-specific recombinase